MSTLKLINGGFPTVLMTLHAKRKMDLIIHSVTTEIGWLGFVERLPDNEYLITDVVVPKQEVNGGTCEITEDGLVELADSILSEEGGLEKVNTMRLWGHSHANMGTSPSGQDNTQMEIFTKNVKDFFIRLIANKKGEYNFTVYEYDRNLITEEAPTEIVTDDDEALKAEIKETVAKNVKELTYHKNTYSTGYGDSCGGGSQFWTFDQETKTWLRTDKDNKAIPLKGATPKSAIGFLNSKISSVGRQLAGWSEKEGYEYFNE